MDIAPSVLEDLIERLQDMPGLDQQITFRSSGNDVLVRVSRRSSKRGIFQTVERLVTNIERKYSAFDLLALESRALIHEMEHTPL